MATDSYTPRPEHKFTFGLWTVGNRGRDPFGEAVRPSMPPTLWASKVALPGDSPEVFKERHIELIPRH